MYTLAVVEQTHQILHPTALHLHREPTLTKSWHQPLKDVVAAFSGLYQHINGTLPATGVATIASVQPGLLQGIRNQEQWIPRRSVTPVSERVPAHGKNANPRGYIESITTAVGVVRHTVAPQAADQPWNIKTPADDPKHIVRGGFIAEKVVQEGDVLPTLPVRDDLRLTQ